MQSREKVQSSPTVPKPRVRPSSFVSLTKPPQEIILSRIWFAQKNATSRYREKLLAGIKNRGPTPITGIDGGANAADFHFWPFHGPGKYERKRRAWQWQGSRSASWRCGLRAGWALDDASIVRTPQANRRRWVLALLETPLIRREREKIPRFRICCKTTSSSRLFAANGAYSCFIGDRGSYCDRDSLSVLFFLAASIAFTMPSAQQRGIRLICSRG